MIHSASAKTLALGGTLMAAGAVQAQDPIFYRIFTGSAGGT